MNCKREVRKPGPWPHYSPCKRRAVTDAGFCKQHDPQEVKARCDKRNAEHEAKWQEERRVFRIRNAALDLLSAAKEVMALIEEHGGAIVPHLLDNDDNAGQRLRDAIARAEPKS